MIKEFRGQYRWLSNFTPVNIEVNKIIYPSVEHAFMSAKSNDISWKRFCADSNNSAGAVKKKSKSIKLVKDWDIIKYDIMEECLRQKFNQEPFRTKLLSTRNIDIQEEDRWNDTIWGVCLKTNIGDNKLGKLIMKIRKELQEQLNKEIDEN